MVSWCFTGAFFGILGMPFWTLFVSESATLGTGRVHGTGPSGTSWRGVLVWYGRAFGILGMPFSTLFSTNQKATLGAGRVRGSGPSGTSWHLVLVFYGRIFSHLGDTILDLVFFESESNVRHQPCPWFGAFGHLLAWCSGVVEARFLASWGCHCGPCFLRIRKQR